MLELYKNIKKQRQLLKMTQTELAKKMGYADKSMIAKIEKGLVDLPQSKILAFAEALQTSPSDLMGLDGTAKDTYIYDSAGIDYIKVPLFGNLCCGDGGFVDDNMIEMIAIPSQGLNPNIEYFCQYATGESMINAGIEEGDLLVFERCDKVPSGVIGCFCIADNEATCKKYKEMENIIVLQPMNNDFDPIIIDPYNNNVRCIGKLRKVIKTFNWEEYE